MNKLGRFQVILNETLDLLKWNHVSLGGEIFRLLFDLSFDSLKAAETANSLEHPLVVLKHMIEIAQSEDFNILNAGAISILHDISPVEKIRRADVIAESDENKRNLLEQKRRQHRTLHMREGSALAQKKLLLLNDYMGYVLYNDEDIEEICEVIRIHDNPSIGIPIPNENRLAVSFREADRLYMLSDEGFAFDISRDRKLIENEIDSHKLAIHRFEHVIERFREERNLYSINDGPFQDEFLFFRTKEGYNIYQRYVDERKAQLAIL